MSKFPHKPNTPYIPDPYIIPQQKQKSNEMKTPEEMAEEWARRFTNGESGMSDCIQGFLAGYKAAQQWISVKDRLPDSQDGITQVWLRKSSWIEEGHICPFVLGSHAMMYTLGENDKDGIEGICDIHKPDGVWEISDFTHWMPLPKAPKGKK